MEGHAHNAWVVTYDEHPSDPDRYFEVSTCSVCNLIIAELRYGAKPEAPAEAQPEVPASFNLDPDL
jgi:hypothetical protein